jgi:hypothetical protein
MMKHRIVLDHVVAAADGLHELRIVGQRWISGAAGSL